MAATGKTPILLYGSTTATNQPSAGNLTNSSDGCEIAINVADKNLFFKDATNTVNTVPIRQSGTSSNGWLSSTDWNTFNNKQPAGTYVTSVTGTAPVVSSGGTTPAISMAAANGSTNGYLTSTDWTTFNGKAPSFTYTTGYIPFGQGTTTPTQSSNLFWDNANGRLGVGTNTPDRTFYVYTPVSSGLIAGFSNGYTNTNFYISASPSGGQVILNASNNAQTAAQPLAFAGNGSEWGRFHSSGGMSIGNTTDPGATNLSVTGSITSNGSLNASLGNVGTGPFSLTGNSQAMVYSGSSNAGYTQGMSSLATVFFMAKNTAQGRSINAAGTLNANGADYAEYMVKNGNFKIAKGDICGVDANGKLTIVYDEAVTFVVKSTDPSFVGGDSWGSEETVGKRPEDTESQEYKDWEANLEKVRQTVDRVAFAGRVPVNVSNAVSGDYIVPVKNQDGSIDGIAIAETDLTLSQYIKSVGQVVSVEDSVVTIIVKVA